MNKKLIVTILLCFCFVTMAFGCAGAASSGKDSTGVGTSGAAPLIEAGKNQFSLTVGSVNGSTATVKLALGGTKVSIAGFEILITFNNGATVQAVESSDDFSSLTSNYATAGRVKLVWADIANVTSACDVCELTVSLGALSSCKFEITVVSAGYITENNAIKNVAASDEGVTVEKN